MINYPEVVSKLVDDYLRRVRLQLGQLPALEQDEFVREIQSHLYDAYQQMPGEDEVTRILTVLRNFGEPSEVVQDRLPAAMVRSGTNRNLPLYVLGGILIALFGIPLGFGGVAVLVGILITLAAMVAAFYAIGGVVFLTGALLMLMGFARTAAPEFWDRMVALGFIRLDGPAGDFLDQLPASEQGLLMIVLAALVVAGGLGMLWVGRYLIRGLRFLFSLALDRLREFAERIRRRAHPDEVRPPVAAMPAMARK
jgi:uncharacterized membrane protein